MSRGDRHAASHLADTLGVSASWARTLRRRVERGERTRGPGRPRLSETERERVRALVLEQLKIQGLAGWRDVLAGIRGMRPGERVSVMLVQQETSAEKLRRRTKARRALEEAREGHEVLARDAVWSEDATHLGRLEDGAEVSGEVIVDRGTLGTVSLTAGQPLTAEDACAVLRAAAAERGGFPFVLQVDGAGLYRAPAMRALCEAERMVLLRSRPHTPTDNPAVEHRNGELKAETGLGKGVRLTSDREAAAVLAPARERVDARRRATRGYRSARELDAQMPRAAALVEQDRFFAAARSAMAEAVRRLTDVTEIARAEQLAVWHLLETSGLARSVRGRRALPCPPRASVAPTRIG